MASNSDSSNSKSLGYGQYAEDQNAADQHAEDQHAEDQSAEDQSAEDQHAEDENNSAGEGEDPKDGDYPSNSTTKPSKETGAQQGESSESSKKKVKWDSLYYCPLCKQSFEGLGLVETHWTNTHHAQNELIIPAEKPILAKYHGLTESEKKAASCSSIFEKETIRRRLAAEK